MHDLPKAGELYYHFKHNPEKDIFNYAYKIVGTGKHSETDEIFIVYKALYKSPWIEESAVDFTIRPIKMFMENVEKNGQSFPRFKKIEDLKLIDKISTDYKDSQ